MNPNKLMFSVILCSTLIVVKLFWFTGSGSGDEYLDVKDYYIENIAKEKRYKEGSFYSLKEMDKRDRPDLAFIQNYERTLDPELGYPPSDRRFEAIKVARSILDRKKASRAVNNVIWEERGPNNVGGRTRALMFDPNDFEYKKVWAGSVSGGLWYNNDITDSNSKWIAVNDFMSNLSISSIVYDPQEIGIFYLATGEGWGTDIRGAGIWKTEDSGLTWIQLESTNNKNFHYVQDLLISKDGKLFAATLEGLYMSIDQGESWQLSLDGRFGDLELGVDGVIYATTGVDSRGLVYRSRNDGGTWDDISPGRNGARVELAVSTSNPNVIYVVADRDGGGRSELAYFARSDDQGESWTNLTIPNYTEQDCTIGESQFTRGQAWYDLIIAVNPEDEYDVIVGGIDLHRSVDGGREWALISYWTGACDDYVHADQHEIVFRPGFSGQALFGTDGGVFYSSNIISDNPTFDARNNGYNVTQFYSVATLNRSNVSYYLAGSQDNGTQRFDQSGLGSTVEVTDGDGGYCFIDQVDPNIQITSYVYNSYRYSNNGGLSFVAISDNQSKGEFINPSAYDSDSKILYSAGGADEILRITDMDTDPSEQVSVGVDLSSAAITHILVSELSNNTLFVGTSGVQKVSKITSSNTSSPVVTDISGDLKNISGTVSSIDVGNDENHLLITFSNYGIVSVFETINGGATWNEKEGNLPDMPVRWGIFNPLNSNEVLLATEVGVWSTNDFGADSPEWEPTNDKLANVRCDMIKYRKSDNQVVVATHGRGIFTSNVFASTPVADFRADRLVGYAGIQIAFQDASQLADSWLWDFGDGNTATDQNPDHVFTDPGEYQVTLTINGSEEMAEKTITILPLRPTPYLLADGGDFESNDTDFAAKSLLNGETLWELGSPGNVLASVSSGSKAWKTDLDADLEDKGFDYKAALYTPGFDFSDASKEYRITFDKSLENGYCNAPMAMQLQYSTDGGLNWSTLGSGDNQYGSLNWYNRSSSGGCAVAAGIFEDQQGWVYSFLPANSPPVNNVVHGENTAFNLNFLAGQDKVAFRYVVGVATGYGDAYDRDGFMIDNFQIEVSDPTAEFASDVRQGPIGREIAFLYRGNGAETFNWNFGDGNSSNEAAPTHSYNASGKYTVSLTITSLAGEDMVVKSDFITILNDYQPPYLLENGGNFEVNQDDFVADNVTGTPFELGVSAIEGKNGTASGSFAWVTGINDVEYVDDSEAALYTPSFDFQNLARYTLSFKAKHSFEDNWDGFIVQYSTNLGKTWVKLNSVQEDGWYNQISDPQSVFGVSVPIFSGDTGGEFMTYSTDLTFLAGHERIMLRFLFLTDAASVDAGMALDDFSLTSEPLVAAVPDFIVEGMTGCNGQQITFTDASSGDIKSYSWDFGEGASPATAKGIGPHNVTYSGTGTAKSSVELVVEGLINGEVSEAKTDFINIAPVHKPTITRIAQNSQGTQLQASEGESYQWYFDNEPIDGATSRDYLASQDGIYVVEVVVAGCSQASEGFDTSLITSIDSFQQLWRLYPNPASGSVRIDRIEGIDKTHLNIYNLTGRVVLSQSLTGRSTLVDIDHLMSGAYVVEVGGANPYRTRLIVN